MSDERTIELEQIRPHKSVVGLGVLKLPTMCAIAGVNGAGKTHLLEAIKNGAIRVRVEGQLVELGDIVLYDWTTFAMNESPEVSEAPLRQQAEKEWRNVGRVIRSGTVQQLANAASDGLGISADTDSLLTQDLTVLTADPGKQTQIESLRRDCRASLLDQLHDSQRSLVNKVEMQAGQLIFSVDEADFVDAAMMEGRSVDPLRQRISELFVAYNSIMFRNDAHRLMVQEEGDDLRYLSIEEFESRYGPPPWVVLDNLLADEGLDFTIKPPSRSDTTYTARLVQRTSGVEVPFADLSSGEKILVALAISLYGTVEERHPIKLPKMMLLDELDAPLHPAMVRNYLRTIQDLFVANGVTVVATTHSPSTVALCPEGSVFVMEKTLPRIRRESNRRVLAHLTAGVSALTVRFEDRRQVFVESGYDANAYTSILDALRPRLDAEFGVVFMPSSGRKEEGGCRAVAAMVTALRKAGVETTRGVIDWDLRNRPSEDGAILVLGHDRRYTIENYLFDPLLIAALLIREKREGIIPNLDTIVEGKAGTWRGLDRAESSTLQVIADAALSLLPNESTEDLISCPLVGGASVELPAWFCHLPGHELFELWREAVPFLRSYKTEANLRRAILERVVADVPELLSFDLLELMTVLANEPGQ